jgi:hypothetical protein
MLQKELHEKCKADIQSVRERLIKVVRPLDGARLNERPEPNGWSVGEVLEHLCVSDELYMPKMTKLIAAARRDAGAANREWKPTLLGGMIAGALEKPRKVKALKVFQPGATPRNGVLEAFLALQQSVLRAMDDASSVDWRAVRLGSVAMPWFAPKMNLGDAFRIHAVHSVRHAGQIERVVALM